MINRPLEPGGGLQRSAAFCVGTEFRSYFILGLLGVSCQYTFRFLDYEGRANACSKGIKVIWSKSKVMALLVLYWPNRGLTASSFMSPNSYGVHIRH